MFECETGEVGFEDLGHRSMSIFFFLYIDKSGKVPQCRQGEKFFGKKFSPSPPIILSEPDLGGLLPGGHFFPKGHMVQKND